MAHGQQLQIIYSKCAHAPAAGIDICSDGRFSVALYRPVVGEKLHTVTLATALLSEISNCELL
jgi:hypothetical protein